MQVSWPSSAQLTGVTSAAATDTLTKVAHGLADGTALFFLEGTDFAGLTAGRRYFVRDAATDTFKLAATAGGAAVDLTDDGTAGVFAAAVEIAAGLLYAGHPGDRLEGAPAAETVAPWEAAVARALSRGGRVIRLPLSVPREFDTERLAGIFFFTHYAALADAGPLLVTVGFTGDTSDLYAEALLEQCTPSWQRGAGNSRIVVVDYLFQVGAFTAV